MRGRKSDKEYVSNFIETSVMSGKTSLEDILKDVFDKISNIDLKIKEVEDLKKERSKLLDVKEFLVKSLYD